MLPPTGLFPLSGDGGRLAVGAQGKAFTEIIPTALPSSLLQGSSERTLGSGGERSEAIVPKDVSPPAASTGNPSLSLCLWRERPSHRVLLVTPSSVIRQRRHSSRPRGPVLKQRDQQR